MGELRRTALAVVISLVLVATAIVSLWLLASAGVFTAEGTPLSGAPAATGIDPGAGVTFPVGGRVQVSQPRDPFAPLATEPLVVEDSSTTAPDGVTSTSSVDGGSTTTSADGVTTTSAGGTSTTGTAATSTTAGGTTTSVGDQPIGTRIALLEIREEQGVRLAVMTVDGETYTAGVGEQVGDELKVVSLSTSSGVFQIDDRVFSLAVGQSILK